MVVLAEQHFFGAKSTAFCYIEHVSPWLCPEYPAEPQVPALPVTSRLCQADFCLKPAWEKQRLSPLLHPRLFPIPTLWLAPLKAQGYVEMLRQQRTALAWSSR